MPGAFERAGLDRTQRAFLFAVVCVPVRVALALSLPRIPPMLVGAGAAVASVYLAMAPGDVRWSRKSHALFASAVAVAAVNGLPDLARAIALADVACGAVAYGRAHFH